VKKAVEQSFVTTPVTCTFDAVVPWQVDGDTRRSLLMAGDDDEVFVTISFNVTPKTTEQHLIVRSDKSEAEVVNNRRVRSQYCTGCFKKVVLLKRFEIFLLWLRILA